MKDTGSEGGGSSPGDDTQAAERKPSGPLSTDSALAEMEKRAFRKALDREGEPETPLSPYEPEEYEVFGEVTKFRCRCGKRISAPINPRKSIGKCPKCRARLVLPKVTAGGVAVGKSPAAAGHDEPGEESRDRSHKMKKAVAAAADRLRGQPAAGAGACAGFASVGVQSAAPTRRFVAFLIDAGLGVAVFFGVALTLKALGGRGASPWAAGGVLLILVWIANRILAALFFSATAGMAAAGLRLRRSDGAVLTFATVLVRALAGVGLMPLAPRALSGGDGLTPADKVAGTVVVSARSI